MYLAYQTLVSGRKPGGGVINQVSRIALKLTGLHQNLTLSPNIAVLDASEASLGLQSPFVN